MKKWKKAWIVMALLIVSMSLKVDVEASDGEEYVTITVDAIDSSDMTYSIDSDDPASFSSSNEFKILAGTTHTIYVKDAAGNITSQEYTSSASTVTTPTVSTVSGNEIQEAETSSADSLKNPEDIITDAASAEDGQGTVYDKVNTDGSADSSRVFYTVTTKDGEVFYLVIDQKQGTNNVYLLDQVRTSDLYALAVDDDDSRNQTSQLADSLFDFSTDEDESSSENMEPELKASDDASRKKGSFGNIAILFIIMAIGGAVYYYMKVYKNKKNEQMDLLDAMDREDFVADDAEKENDEVDFGLGDDYQEDPLVEDEFDPELDGEEDE